MCNIAYQTVYVLSQYEPDEQIPIATLTTNLSKLKNYKIVNSFFKVTLPTRYLIILFMKLSKQLEKLGLVMISTFWMREIVQLIRLLKR